MHNHDCTFLGLHKWHNHMFEHLGWMTMAKKYGNNLKIDAYLDGINRLLDSLKTKITNTKDEDRKDDLKILLDNTECLLDCAKQLLDSTTHRYNKECNVKKAHDATYYGLHCWMKHKFEKLGWMCLAKKHGNFLKVQAYLDSIEHLRASLKKKLDVLNEKDHKNDINIINDDVSVLHSAAHKLLGDLETTHLTKTSSRKSSRKSYNKSSRKSSRKHSKKSFNWF